MPRLLLIKTGDTFPEVIDAHGDFERLFAARLAGTAVELEVLDAQRTTVLPALQGVDGLLITGSHAMVSDAEPWSEALKPWLAEAFDAQLPMLGVCYGHQLLAEALGGRSGYHPDGREVGTFAIDVTEDGRRDALLGGLPARFPAHLTHSQSVLVPPKGATVLANNAHDPHQALRFGPRQWGVQFHPEFTLPVMRAYLARQHAALRDAGQDPEALLTTLAETPTANGLIARFAGLLAQ